MSKRPLALLAAATMMLALAGCGDDDEGSSASDPTSASTSDATTDEASPTTPEPTDEPTTSATTPSEVPPPAAGEVACTYAPSPVGSGVAPTPPPANAPAQGTREVTLQTTIGELDLQLDAAAAPCTVNSFVSLTEQGFFDGTTCHRLTTQGIFVLQCGDPGNGPIGPGSGGPGYGVQDEFPAAPAYGPGTLAMAKTPAPDSGGSQFFIVYDGPATQLPPQYTIFGKLTGGLDLVQEAAAQGTAEGTPDGTPKVTVQIETATVG